MCRDSSQQRRVLGTMVLEELGGKISAALRNLSGGDAIDKAAFDAALKEISNALVQSDVEVSLVMKMRMNIQKKVKLPELAAGIDKRAVIEKAVRDELCSLLDGSGEASVPKPKRGKPYVAMFVGLQVRFSSLNMRCRSTFGIVLESCATRTLQPTAMWKRAQPPAPAITRLRSRVSLSSAQLHVHRLCCALLASVGPQPCETQLAHAGKRENNNLHEVRILL